MTEEDTREDKTETRENKYVCVCPTTYENIDVDSCGYKCIYCNKWYNKEQVGIYIRVKYEKNKEQKLEKIRKWSKRMIQKRHQKIKALDKQIEGHKKRIKIMSEEAFIQETYKEDIEYEEEEILDYINRRIYEEKYNSNSCIVM
jgi:hypothetical protein